MRIRPSAPGRCYAPRSEAGEKKTWWKGAAEFNQGEDIEGPVVLGVVSTLSVSSAAGDSNGAQEENGGKDSGREEAEKDRSFGKEARVVVIGDSDFANNAFLRHQRNGDLFLNAVSWLAEDEDLISVRPKNSENRSVQMTPAHSRTLWWVTMVALPGAALGLGLLVWSRETQGMIWRNLGLMAVLFVGLGAFVYFYEIEGGKKREEAAEQAKKLFQFDKEEVNSISLDRDSGSITLKKENGGWKLVAPIEAKADETAVDGLASELSSIQVERSLEPGSVDWKDYGLENPNLKISVGFAGWPETGPGAWRQGLQPGLGFRQDSALGEGAGFAGPLVHQCR